MGNKPTIQERSREKLCPNCGKGPVERRSPKGPPPIFCSKVCKRDMNNRLTVEGRALVAFVKAWRIDRGVGEIAKVSLRQVCDIADLFNARDLEAGRPRADLYASKLLPALGGGGSMFVTRGTRYIDRETVRKVKEEA